MWFADSVGLKKILARIEDFHHQYGVLWQPARLLERLAAQGSTFASLDAAKAQETSA
jgi:3-hydroxyacyl-CoA dehydrogenase